VLREAGFDLGSLAVLAVEKPTAHLSSVLRLWPLAAMGARVQRNERQAHPQHFARIGMIVLAIKAGIAQTRIDVHEPRRLLEQRAPETALVARPTSDASGNQQVGLDVAADSEFSPVPLTNAPLSNARLVMFAGVAFFKSRGIDRDTSGMFKETLRCKPAPESGPTTQGMTYRAAVRRGIKSSNAGCV
jgi:hypothetical protein